MSKVAGKKRALTADEKAAEAARRRIKSSDVRQIMLLRDACKEKIFAWMSHIGVHMQEVLLHVKKLSKLIEKEPKIAK